jgi:hypothetical protein
MIGWPIFPIFQVRGNPNDENDDTVKENDRKNTASRNYEEIKV